MKKEFDKEIFKEMILYISKSCEDKPAFGSTHLNKTLHYSDLLWYGLTGEAISNETYIREEHGQIPKHLLQVREELQAEGMLKIEERNYFGKLQKRPIVTKPISYKRLTEDQKKLIDEVSSALVGFNASEVSNLIAHQDLAWQYLNNGEEIPCETVFFRRKNSISDETMNWAKAAIDEYEANLRREESVVQGC